MSRLQNLTARHLNTYAACVENKITALDHKYEIVRHTRRYIDVA